MTDTRLLTKNDDTVLAQIFDPESAPSAGILVDSSLPEDPHILDTAVWNELRTLEKAIIIQVEAIIKDQRPKSDLETPLKQMKQLMSKYPDAACLLNDYAQLLKILYGDDLVSGARMDLSIDVYQTLSKAINLLTPQTLSAAVSPVQCRTLAQAYTQRGSLSHGLVRVLDDNPSLNINLPDFHRPTSIDLQEAASKDFFMGGKYGNQIGKALAVHTNPTGKLCGQMIKNALRQEIKANQSAI